MREAYCRGVDAINEWLGNTLAWVFIPFMLLVVTDVFFRYALNTPKTFFYDINGQLLGLLILLGGVYVLRHGAHVAVDILVLRLSPRKRAILDLILFWVFLFAIGTLAWKLGVAAWDSLLRLEHAFSAFRPPIYPYKIMMVVAVFLLLLQGIAKFIRDLAIVIPPKSAGKP